MSSRLSVIVLVSALLAGAPLAAAQQHNDPNAHGAAQYASDEESGYTGGPVEVTMYHHVYNLLDKVPMNTQPMDPSATDINKGFGTPTLVTPTPVNNGATFNQIYMFNSPGPVHYNTSLSQPRYHPERGLAEDLVLDTSKPVTAYWYLSAEASQGPGFRSPTPVGGLLKDLHVRATLRTGDDVGANLDAGQVIAEGETILDLQTAPGAGATEIGIELGTPAMQTIPASESFNLKIDWYQVDQNGVEYMSKDWVLHSGTQHPNRLVWTIENPIRIDYLHPQFIGDRKLVVHAALNSPFGNYDVDVDGQKLTESLRFTGPDGSPVRPKTIQGPIIVQKSFVHNHHFEPVLVTWVWNYRDDGANPGAYQVSLEASNLQGSAQAAKAGVFSVLKGGRAGEAIASSGDVIAPQQVDGDSNESPVPTAIVPVGILAAALVAMRRRRR